MADLGKLLVGMGVVLVLVGGGLVLAGRHGGIPRLPGDIVIERDGFRFAFPLGWSILLSVVLTLVLSLLARLKG